MSGPRLLPTRADALSAVNSDPLAEAKSLLPLIESGRETVEMVRALICITPREEAVLYQIEQKLNAERAISCRKMILQEFERLVTRDLKADVCR